MCALHGVGQPLLHGDVAHRNVLVQEPGWEDGTPRTLLVDLSHANSIVKQSQAAREVAEAARLWG